MAAIDFFSIEEQIQTVLKNNANVKMVVVEEELMFAAELSPWVGIYLSRRDAPEEKQTIAAGRRTTYELRISIWTYAWALEIKQACKFRDQALGRVELALMDDRAGSKTINQGDYWLEGGEFQAAKDEESGFFIVGAETVLVTEAQVIAT